jgi:ectoine hydroxylase-related dioxygenase (phytanoyl-CoA dioxygenase family)
MQGLRASSSAGPLRRALREDGYVYLPQFLSEEETRPVIAQLQQALHSVGWLADSMRRDIPSDSRLQFTSESFRDVYPAVQRLEAFHRLAFAPRLLTLMQDVLEAEIFCHPAKVIRLAPPTSPEKAYSTGPHQDFVRLHVASDVLTAWICLTNCTPSCQGLRILADSHRSGFLGTDDTLPGTLPVYLRISADDRRWMSADYRIGDVVVFHSLTVHAGGPNATNTLRFSADVRYQRRGEPLRSEWVRPHGWPLTPDWPELTQGWTTDEWIRPPPDVPLVPMPTDVTYAEYVASLAAPPSRLLGY